MYFLIISPVFSISPKYYYNLRGRERRNKNTIYNSANFFSLSLKYYPDLFVISNHRNVNLHNTFAIIPCWGFRRNIGGKFNYKFKFGIGKMFYKNYSKTGAIIEFKFGYDFFTKH